MAQDCYVFGLVPCPLLLHSIMSSTVAPPYAKAVSYIAMQLRLQRKTQRKVAHEKPTDEALDEKAYEMIVKDFDHKLDKMMKDLDESQNYIESRIDALNMDQFVKVEYIERIIETACTRTAGQIGDGLAKQFEERIDIATQFGKIIAAVDEEVAEIKDCAIVTRHEVMEIQARLEVMEFGRGSEDNDDGVFDAYLDDESQRFHR